MLTPLVIVLALIGGAWGFAADRIAARWPAHEDGSVRAVDWRTLVVVLTGAFALGGLTLRFAAPVEIVVFGSTWPRWCSWTRSTSTSGCFRT